MSLEGHFSHGAHCHLAGAILDGSLHVTFPSAISLCPSSEAANTWARFQRDCPWLQQDSLRPEPEMVSRPKNPLFCHLTFLPHNLLEASFTLVFYSIL